MSENEIANVIFNITLVLFSVSYAWMVNDRINNFPKIRRFYAICDTIKLIAYHKNYNEKKKMILKYSGPLG